MLTAIALSWFSAFLSVYESYKHFVTGFIFELRLFYRSVTQWCVERVSLDSRHDSTDDLCEVLYNVLFQFVITVSNAGFLFIFFRVFIQSFEFGIVSF